MPSTARAVTSNWMPFDADSISDATIADPSSGRPRDNTWLAASTPSAADTTLGAGVPGSPGTATHSVGIDDPSKALRCTNRASGSETASGLPVMLPCLSSIDPDEASTVTWNWRFGSTQSRTEVPSARYKIGRAHV